MTTVSKTLTFDAAHVLTDHAGLCRNLHGHTYRVEIGVAAPADGAEMVIDFKELKRLAGEAFVDAFDHAFICNETSAGEREIGALVERLGMRVARIPFRSTAENLARHFFGLLAPKVAGLAFVRVWETAANCAEFRGEGGAPCA